MTRKQMLDTAMRRIAHEAYGQVLERHIDALAAIGVQLGDHLTDADLAALDDHLRAVRRFAQTMEASDS